MASGADKPRPCGHEIFEGSLSGAQKRPFVPRLRSDPPSYHPLARSLEDFRSSEGHEERERRLRALFKKLPRKKKHTRGDHSNAPIASGSTEPLFLTKEKAEKLTEIYEDELRKRCAEEDTVEAITWTEFKRYADNKEAELWHVFHDELDLDGNGHLDTNELATALSHADITLKPDTLTEFMTFLTSSSHSHAISFPEFRDFLLLLPRKPSTVEIYRYYEVRKYMGDDGRGAARVTMEGDVTLSAEDRPPPPIHKHPHPHFHQPQLVDYQAEYEDDDSEYNEDEEFDEEEMEEHHFSMSFKFLLAGGIAGAVSRTATAPFDRLKVFLITRAPELVLASTVKTPTDATQVASQGIKAIGGAVSSIYSEAGIRGFWVGNGLSVAKIFPESAIKFFSYETSKQFFAQYVDMVDDTRNISGTSRFISGGIGGISSQLAIYPIETLKTQMMSSSGARRSLTEAAISLWHLGGLRAYYRGLVIGLIGVFPYAAIDMSAFEALKLAYLRSTGKEEPGVLPLLVFGSLSGGVGATSVYPLNLVRTRLQASGSPGHPQRYTGILDVARRTYHAEGWRGFYRGLVPTLAKVIPSVSITYVVYEHSKKRLGL